jgi:putative FmdB family regulatory protein
VPLYEYLCENCERSFERLSSIAKADETPCPFCGTAQTRRLVSVIGGLGTQSHGPISGCGCGGSCSCN